MNNDTAETTPTVLIVGAGPVGILNALGLARAGVNVQVFERGTGIAMAPRAMVYHWSVLDGLERMGLLEDAAERGFLKQDYTYKVHKTGEEIHFGLGSLEGHRQAPAQPPPGPERPGGDRAGAPGQAPQCRGALGPQVHLPDTGRGLRDGALRDRRTAWLKPPAPG